MPLTGALPAPTAAEVELGRNADALFQMLTGHWVAQIVRTAAELRVIDHLAAGAERAADIAELESADAGTVHRLLRACASLGLLTASPEGRFAVTALGGLLQEGVPGSLRNAALVQSANGHWQAWSRLPEAVRAGRSQAEAALGKGMFEYFADVPEEAECFSRAMSDMTGLVVQDTVRLVDLAGARTIVDVGGANGSLLLALLEAHAGTEGVVLDLPHVVGGARLEAEKAGLEDRLTAVAGDFFVQVPEGDYYLLKWIMHDWADDDCARILRNCRRAARPGARLLVVEAVVKELGSPDPAALLDMNMLAVTEGQERDLDHFDALFAAAGWRRVGLSATRSLHTLIEVEAI
jgi:SAM-dependent methyltransferase